MPSELLLRINLPSIPLVSFPLGLFFLTPRGKGPNLMPMANPNPKAMAQHSLGDHIQ